MKEKGKREERSRWYFAETKTRSSVRTVKIGKRLTEELKEYRKIQMENQMKYGEYYTFIYKKEEDDEKGNKTYRLIEIENTVPVALPQASLAIRKENGEYSSLDSFKYATRIIHHEMHIEFNFHSLRHTHATRLIESGVSPKAVQERLGHKKIETTLQTYVHNTEQMEQEAVDVFEKAVSAKAQ